MPIGDLLAQIKGEQPSRRPVAPSKPVAPVDSKRKAEGGLNGHTAKIAKTSNPEHRATQPASSVRPFVPKPSAKSTSSAVGQRGDALVAKQTRVVSSTERGPPSTAGGSGSSKPVSTKPDASADKAPKKKSYAEIMQRADRLKSLVGPVGRIQHKPVTQTTSSAVRRSPSTLGSATRIVKPGKPGSRKVWRSEARAGNGLAHTPAQKDGTHDTSSRETSSDHVAARANLERSLTGKKPHGSSRNGHKLSAPEPEKKVKKAALATTGYKGTARPTAGPAATPSSRSKPADGNSSPSRDPDRKSRHAGVFGARRSRREEREDEEMDDFIEYDDDEEPQSGYPVGRGRYDDSEEDESDMEAGFTDVELEDQRAALIARREDEQQEALERKLKREKEERKRTLLQGHR